MAVHNAIALEVAREQDNHFANIHTLLGHQPTLEGYGNLENDISEDQIRQLIQTAGRAGIPVIGNIRQLQTFITQYNQAEMLGQQLFHMPGYGQVLLQDQWGLADVEINEIIRVNNFLNGSVNSMNFIINTQADQVLVAGHHWITVRIERLPDGQLRQFVLDSLPNVNDYRELLHFFRDFIAANAH